MNFFDKAMINFFGSPDTYHIFLYSASEMQRRVAASSLKAFVKKLQEERKSMMLTVAKLESINLEPGAITKVMRATTTTTMTTLTTGSVATSTTLRPRCPSNASSSAAASAAAAAAASAETQKMDLENAVLLQELLAMKEEKIEWKNKVFLLAKEKSVLDLKLSSKEAQEKGRVHVQMSCSKPLIF